MTRPTPPLDLPEVGAAVMLDGLPSGPEGARVVRREDDLLVLVGRGVARHAGTEVSLLFVDEATPARVVVRLMGPAGSDDHEVRALALGRPRAVERRRAVRIPITVLARVSGDPVPGTMGSVTENASAWGALVRAREALAPGSEHRVELSAGGELIATDARVVRCDPVGGDGCARWRIALAFPEPVWALDRALGRGGRARREAADGG